MLAAILDGAPVQSVTKKDEHGKQLKIAPFPEENTVPLTEEQKKNVRFLLHQVTVPAVEGDCVTVAKTLLDWNHSKFGADLAVWLLSLAKHAPAGQAASTITVPGGSATATTSTAALLPSYAYQGTSSKLSASAGKLQATNPKNGSTSNFELLSLQCSRYLKELNEAKLM
jgi:hypothetical protein